MEDQSPVKLYHFIYPGGNYAEHLAPDGQYTQQSSDGHYMEQCSGQYVKQAASSGQYLECSSSDSSSHSPSGYYSNCYSVSTSIPLLTSCHGYCFCL